MLGGMDEEIEYETWNGLLAGIWNRIYRMGCAMTYGIYYTILLGGWILSV